MFYPFLSVVIVGFLSMLHQLAPLAIVRSLSIRRADNNSFGRFSRCKHELGQSCRSKQGSEHALTHATSSSVPVADW